MQGRLGGSTGARNGPFRSAEGSATMFALGKVRQRVDRRSVTGRAFAVLETFTPECPALTLSEISRRAALPLTTTHRLVGELCASRALERDGDGRYRVGLRLW